MTGAMLSLRGSWPPYVGMTVAGAAAIVASASTLASLARAAGWVGWTPWLLPAALDVGGWCWLRAGGAPARARRFGRVIALLGAAGTLLGNGAGHLLATGYVRPGPALVVIIGAVPVAVLVALAHLAALLATDSPATGGIDVAPDAPSERPTRPVAVPATATVEPIDTGDTRAAVLTVILERPVTVAELVKATGRSRTTIVGHLTALTDDGAIVRDDASKRYRAVTRPHLVEEAVQ